MYISLLVSSKWISIKIIPKPYLDEIKVVNKVYIVEIIITSTLVGIYFILFLFKYFHESWYTIGNRTK